MSDLPGLSSVEHHFVPAESTEVYLKRSVLAAGAHLRQHRHAYDHASMLVSGSVLVSRDGEHWTPYEGRAVLLLQAGVAHEVRALTDAVWYCIHPTDERAPEKVDQVLIEGGA